MYSSTSIKKCSTCVLTGNIFALLMIIISLMIAFYYQLFIHELPCPLCLLQRAGIMIVGFGFLFNLFFGVRGLHYSLVLMGCLITGIIATRQILLHIEPGDPGYGSAFLGLHLYTWSLILSIFFIILTAFFIFYDKCYAGEGNPLAVPTCAKWAALLFSIVVAGNLVSTFLECGTGQCADDPTSYQLLENSPNKK